MENLVQLRPVTEADLPHYVRWFNDPAVVGLLITEVSAATETTEWVWLHSKLADPTERLWSMEVDGRLIGNCALHLRGEQGAELGILIGEKDAWSQGYGTDTVRQLLAIAFGELGLWRVWLRTRGSNGRAVRCYQKAGFRQEGVQRQAIWRQGQWVDVMLMAILRSEWEQRGVVAEGSEQ